MPFKSAGAIAVTTGTSLSIPVPAVAAGDYGVMWLYQAYSESPPTVAGWSVAYTELDGAGGVAQLLYRSFTATAAASNVNVTVAANGTIAKVVTWSGVTETTAPTVATRIDPAIDTLITPALTVDDPTGVTAFGFIYQARTAGAVSTDGAITATATARAWDAILGAYTLSTVTADVTTASGGTIQRAFTGGTGNTWNWAATLPVPADPGVAPTIAALGTITAGVPFSQNLLASGDPATFTVTAGTLPPGFTLSSAGVLSGTTPFDWAPYDFTVQAVNAAGSDSERFQGSIRLPGETARTTGTTGTTAWTRFAATVAGDGVLIYVPTGADPTVVVSMMHGAGPDETWPDDEPAPSRDFALNQGWAVMGANAGGVSYASDTALDAWDAAHAWAGAVWPIDDVILYAASMGSQLALIYAAQERHPGIRGLALVDSLMNLQWYWDTAPSEYRQAIKDAYGFTNDADYATATAGTDPMLLPTTTWDGMNMWVSWSPNDGTILPSQNTTPFLPRASGADVDVYQGSGVHSAPANFAPSVVNPWMLDLWAEEVMAPFTGTGTFTAAVVASPAVTATFTGSGALTATATPVVTVDAAHTGSGALTVTVEPVATVTASFTGAGVLTATVTGEGSAEVAAPLTGSGTLTAVVEPVGMITASFIGAGSLTAEVAVEGTAEVTAVLAGGGTLTATIVPVVDVPAHLAGDGALTAEVATDEVVELTATFTGAGTLTAGVQPIATVTAAFAGAGVLAVSVSTGDESIVPAAPSLTLAVPSRDLTLAVPARTLDWSAPMSKIKHGDRYPITLTVNMDLTGWAVRLIAIHDTGTLELAATASGSTVEHVLTGELERGDYLMEVKAARGDELVTFPTNQGSGAQYVRMSVV